MIYTHEMSDGFILDSTPFSEPNKNAQCKIIAEIKSLRNRCDVRYSISNLDEVMTPSDMVTLMNALRAFVERVHEQADKVRAANKPVKRSKRKK